MRLPGAAGARFASKRGRTRKGEDEEGNAAVVGAAATARGEGESIDRIISLNLREQGIGTYSRSRFLCPFASN